MIERTIYKAIERSIRLRPVTVITGARQVGKTTLCRKLVADHGFSYVTLADIAERTMAVEDPEMFVRTHPAPLVIDEAQYAPGLFDHLESEVDRRRFEGGDSAGMYVVTGSQAYNLMENVTQSMAGRVSVIGMSPLNRSEIHGMECVPFDADPERCIRRSAEAGPEPPPEVFRDIVRGSYPELYDRPELRTGEFYSDYVASYVDRDVAQMVNIQDRVKFHAFLGMVASLTGQELVYSTVANAVGVDEKTVKRWLSILESGGIVRLLRPYSGRSMVKSLTKRPKVYFCDTGLACHLARVTDAETLMAGYLKGPMVETYIVNEIIKTYTDNREDAGFYFYRDTNGNEIDLLIVRDGRVTMVECKAGMTFGASDVKAFSKMEGSGLGIAPSCVMCLTERAYPVRDGVYALPVSSL